MRELEDLRAALASIPEIVDPTEREGVADEYGASLEYSRTLRKMGVQQSKQLREMEERLRALDEDRKELHETSRRERERAVKAEADLERAARLTVEHLDAWKRAVGALKARDDLRVWALELEKAREATIQSFAKLGLSRLGIPGEQFDPEAHDPVAAIPRDEADLVVSAVVTEGFVFRGKVMRRARVELSEQEQG